MSNKNLQSQALSSLLWKMFERVGTRLIQFLVELFLARLLFPEDYGAIALITVFIAVADVFVQSGFPNALIQKKDADELDFSTVFYTSLVISILFYILIYFVVAPMAASFYDMPILTGVLRVLSLKLIIGTYNSMQNTILSKKLLFKRLFYSSFGAIVIAGAVGIACAYAGMGVWALVAQQLTSVLVISVVMTFTVRWRPKLMFSFARLKGLFSFGWKLLCSSLLDTLYNNIYSLIIGKAYSSADLAFWNKGKQFPALIVDNINGSINAVMYPVMAKEQESRERLKAIVRRSINISTYVIFPMMMGLAICAEPLVELVLTEKWLFCVPYLQGWCFIYAWYPVHTVNLQVYKAMGRSDIFLKLEIVKKCIGIGVLLITIPYGLWVMMCGKFATSIISCIINAFPNRQLLGYGYFAQIKDLLPAILLSSVMGVGVWCITLLQLPILGMLLLQVLSGGVIYALGSVLFKLSAFGYILDILKNKMKRKSTV